MTVRHDTPAVRADENFVVHATWAAARTAGMTSRISEELVLADSGLPCDTFNFVCRARFASAADADQGAAAAVAWFHERRRPFSWWVGPADRPSGLGVLLERAGLERAETELAMALPLGRLPRAVPEVDGLEVRRVSRPDQLEAFAQLSAANWTPPDPHVLAFYRLAAPALLAPNSPQWLYIGYLHEEPVATAEATVVDGTAGLYNISTLPRWRGRGIGSLMTWRPLSDARSEGADLGVLLAAPAGVGLYRRLGFRTFGDITEFKPRIEDAVGERA
jgi:ribosomal protein S18 acetylase RimI-like enzyme